jgi:hypothetical protein
MTSLRGSQAMSKTKQQQNGLYDFWEHCLVRPKGADLRKKECGTFWFHTVLLDFTF